MSLVIFSFNDPFILLKAFGMYLVTAKPFESGKFSRKVNRLNGMNEVCFCHEMDKGICSSSFHCTSMGLSAVGKERCWVDWSLAAIHESLSTIMHWFFFLYALKEKPV
jgi:hypothetical protein